MLPHVPLLTTAMNSPLAFGIADWDSVSLMLISNGDEPYWVAGKEEFSGFVYECIVSKAKFSQIPRSF